MCRQKNSAHSMNYEWINYHVYDKELLSLIALHPLLDTVMMSRLAEYHTQFIWGPEHQQRLFLHNTHLEVHILMQVNTISYTHCLHY